MAIVVVESFAPVDISDSAETVVPAAAQPRVIDFVADEDVCFKVGVNAVATTADCMLPALERIDLAVGAGDRVSVICTTALTGKAHAAHIQRS